MHTETLRAFLIVAEVGSLSRAAERLHLAQSTLTRQIQGLEQDVGGKLFERSRDGVALTAAGQRLAKGAGPLLARVEELIAEARKVARGKSELLRVSYLGSMSTDFLAPALRAFRRSHPQVKVTLADLSPGEQIAGLRGGRVDVALLGETDRSVAREFHVKSFGELPVLVAMPDDHRLARQASVKLGDLRSDTFVAVGENDMPGYARWLARAGRKAGFRPRCGETAESLAHALSLVVSDGLVTLVPCFVSRTAVPGVAFRPLPTGEIQWELLAAWQRGPASVALRGWLAALAEAVASANS